MIQSTREAAGRRADEDEKARAAASSQLWSSTLKNPRIVRVSRTFGGKDRHSKVRTVRGLRDRRIRLSVPTAIQLYALQDKLGLNQPSKVVDWLIAAAQHAIDELPPLEMSMIILQAANDHLAAAAAAAGAAPPFPQLHASMGNVVVPQNYMISGGGGDGLDALLARSSKDKEAVKEANAPRYPYYYQNYPMPMFASSSSSPPLMAAEAARVEEETKQKLHKYGGQMAAGSTAARDHDEALNPLRSAWNLHGAAGVPSSMVLQQKDMKSLPFPCDLREFSPTCRHARHCDRN